SATSFAFVAGDDLGLARHAPGHLLGDAQAVEILHAQECVLRHLPVAGSPFARGQAREGLGVAEAPERLPERAHQILAFREIDAGLPADRRIDLAEQRGRDVYDRSSTVIARRRVAVATVHVATGHETADLLDCGARLGLLSVRDRHDLARHAWVDIDADARLGHNGRAAGARRQAAGELAPHAGAHEHFVATLSELDPDAYRLPTTRIVLRPRGTGRAVAHHGDRPSVGESSCARAARTTSSASSSGRRAPTCTTTSESSRYTGRRTASRR